jgi:hypothetical protein
LSASLRLLLSVSTLLQSDRRSINSPDHLNAKGLTAARPERQMASADIDGSARPSFLLVVCSIVAVERSLHAYQIRPEVGPRSADERTKGARFLAKQRQVAG